MKMFQHIKNCCEILFQEISYFVQQSSVIKRSG